MSAVSQDRKEDDRPARAIGAWVSTPPAWPISPYLIVGVVAVVVHVAITLWRLRGGYFFADDFLEIELGYASPLGPRYLLREMFGHVEPLTMLSHWLFAHLAGWNYPASRLVLVSASAGAVAMLAAIARRVQTPPVIAAIVVMAAAVSWTTIEPDRWWCSGVIVTSCTLLSMVALWICARPKAALGWGERALLALVLVADCAFYNKAVFVIVLCGGTRLFIVASSAIRNEQAGFWRAAASALADVAPALVGVVCFLALVLVVKAKSFAPAAPTSMLQGLEGLAAGLQYGWLGGVAGLRVDEPAFKANSIVAAVALDGLAGLVLLSSVRRNPSAAWLWAALVVSVTLGLGVISMQRAAQFGVMAMTVGRYNTDGVFMTFAATLMAFGVALAPAGAWSSGRPGAWLAAAAIGAVVLSLQTTSGLHYPPAWDTQANKRFIEALERDVRRLPASGVVGDRILPDHIAPRWMQPWSDLSKLAPILPCPFRTAAWEQASDFMDDEGALHAFADAPRLTLQQPDRSTLVLAEVPPFENVGFFSKGSQDRAVGWFNCLLADPNKVRIAIVADDRIVAWAVRENRPDVAAFYNRGDLAASGFAAALPPNIKPGQIHAVAVIDGRIGIVLPRG